MKRLIICLLLITAIGCETYGQSKENKVEKIDVIQSKLVIPPGQSLLLPDPRWILRDSNNDSVFIMVSPDSRDFAQFETPVISCIKVDFVDGVPTDLYYGLETGEIGDCANPTYETYDTWRDYQMARFLDSECSGPAYSRYSGSIGQVINVNDIIYYINNSDVSIPDFYYIWDTYTNECNEYDNSAGRWFMAFEQIPESVNNLFPNPPYTLSMEF